jgi:DNA-binding XRE family transcriptional regulator
MQDRQFRDMTRADRQALEMLGAAVRIGRKRMGLSQDALAASAEVSQTAVSRLERGMVWGMAVVRFARVASVLGPRMPLGGCPHTHRCAYDTEWQYARQRALDLMEAGPDADEDDAPGPSRSHAAPAAAVQPPTWWPGWEAIRRGSDAPVDASVVGGADRDDGR